MPKIHWFKLLKCEYLLVVFYDSIIYILRFWNNGQNKYFLTILLGLTQALAVAMVIDIQISIRMLCFLYFTERKETLHRLHRNGGKTQIKSEEWSSSMALKSL